MLLKCNVVSRTTLENALSLLQSQTCDLSLQSALVGLERNAGHVHGAIQLIRSQSSYYATTALAVALAALLGPTAAHAGCEANSSNDNTLQFQSFVAGTVNAVSSVVTTITTNDAALVAQGSSAFVAGGTAQAPDQQGGGVWTRGVGGNFLTSVPSVGVLADTKLSTPIGCQSRVRQGFGGVQAGADVANLNFGGSGVNLHLGLTSGVVEMSSATNTSSTLNFQVPYFGLYSTLTYGDFFADAQIRGNFFEGSITDTANNTPGEKFNARGFTVSGNAGYHLNLPANWFIEPSAGVNWSRTFVDSISFQGTAIFNGNITFGPGMTFFAGPSTLTINDFDNILARASLRVGTTLETGKFILQPFFTASILREFADPIQSSVIGVHNFDAAFVTTDLSTDRIGTFGQFALGVLGQIADSSWSSFVRADYRTGSRFEGWSVAGGARYDFNPEKAPIILGRSAEIAGAAVAPPPYNWSGFFLGVSAPGALWGETVWSFANTGARAANNYSGVLAGGGGGYNYQMGVLVLGGQVEWDWTNARGGESFSGGNSFTCPVNSLINIPTSGFPAGHLAGSVSFDCNTRMNSIFAATGRLGYAFNRLLLYGQGGLAVGDVTAKIVSNSFFPSGTFASGSNTAVGWAAGAGMEFGLTQNISAKAEYLYFDLGNNTYNLGVPVAISRNGNIGRVGLNYRFD